MDHILLFVFRICLCYTVLSVPCSLVITCLGRADLLALCVMFSCVFAIFQNGVLGLVWYMYLIVSISDICLLFYFGTINANIQSFYLMIRYLKFI